MWFKKSKPIDPLKTVDDIYAQVEAKFNERLRQLQQTEQSLRTEFSDLQRKHGELVGKVREQTDADILFMCKKIERDILAEKKSDPNDVLKLNALRAQQQALASQNTYGYGLGGGLLAALGRTGLSAY